MLLNGLLSYGRHTFASLAVRNYRLYFIGQGFSVIGTWMQSVALSWLVLQLTSSGTVIGLVLAVRFFPMFVLGPFAGAIVDRFDKRRILSITQSLFGLFSLILGILVLTGMTELWMIFLIALLTGIVNSIDNPSRQTFVHDMVGREHLRNAITLNSIEVNLARVIGPAIAGIVIAMIGIAVCFFVDAFSFGSILITLALMRSEALHTEPRAQKASLDFRVIFRYLKHAPALRGILIAMTVIGTLAYEFQVSLPLFAQTTFLGDAADYAALLSAMGAGSVAGGLFSASRKEIELHEFVLWAFLFGISILVTAILPNLALATVGMMFVGFFSVNMTSTGNTILQLESAPEIRGRVMSLWSMAILGSTVIGGPLIGLICEHLSPRWGLAVGGAAAILIAVFAGFRMLDREKILSIPLWARIRRDQHPPSMTKF